MRLLLTLLLAFVALTGCLADDPSETDDGTDGQGGPGTVPGGQVPSQHGTPARTDGPVEVEQQDGRWVARQTVTITNGAGAATAADVEQSSVNGGLSVQGWSEPGYLVTARLFAWGDTQQEARDRLEPITIRHEDGLSGGMLSLGTFAEVETAAGLPIIGGSNPDWQNRGASLDLRLPMGLDTSVDQDGVNGGALVTGLDGPAVRASMTNGGVAVSGDFDSLALSCTNGGIAFHGGRFSAGDGSYDLSCVNGGIGMVLTTRDQGFDVTADITNGGIEVQIPDASPVGEQSSRHAHVRSDGYDGKATRTVVDLDGTNGGITVVGS